MNINEALGDVQRPLQVGDLVELAPGHNRHRTNPPWRKRVTEIDSGGDAWIGDWCFSKRELRRVDSPTSDNVVAELRRQLAEVTRERDELLRDVKHAVSETKRREPDYPFGEETASECVWCLGEGLLGVTRACDEWTERCQSAERERDELRKNIDDPELDCTDAAHPAWWRGHDHTAKVFCQLVNEILDGKDVSHGISGEPWQATKMRVADLRTKLATAETGAAAMRRTMTENESRLKDVIRRIGVSTTTGWITHELNHVLLDIPSGTAGRELLERHKKELAELRVQLDNERQFFAVNQHTIEAQAEEIKRLNDRLRSLDEFCKENSKDFSRVTVERDRKEIDLLHIKMAVFGDDCDYWSKSWQETVDEIERLTRKCRTSKAALVEAYRGKIDPAWFGDEVTYWRYPDSETHRFRVTKHHTQTLRLDGGWSVISTDPKWFTSKANTVCIQCNADGTPLAKSDDAALLRKLRELLQGKTISYHSGTAGVCVSLTHAQTYIDTLIAIRDGGKR